MLPHTTYSGKMRSFARSRTLTTKINTIRHVKFSGYSFLAKDLTPKAAPALLFLLKRNITEVVRLVAPNADFSPCRS